MFNFRKKTEQPILKQTVIKEYPAIVHEIHSAFYNAGEQLLKEAKEILNKASEQDADKASLLVKYGFNNTKEAIGYIKEKHGKDITKAIAEAIGDISFKWPVYKFLTKEKAEQICEKYNLVIGEVRQYKGFVPRKNIEEIEEFFKEKSFLNYGYFIESFGWSGTVIREIDEKEFIQMTKQGCHHNNYYYRDNRRKLQIAAPLKDMDKEGYTLKGRMLVKTYPDPIVMVEINHKGVDLYCIVTAWGDEASDKDVINQKMN